MRFALSAAALVLLMASPVRAQENVGRFHWGVFHITPSIAISGVGVDDNVNHDSQNPARDATALVGPAVKIGRAHV